MLSILLKQGQGLEKFFLFIKNKSIGNGKIIFIEDEIYNNITINITNFDINKFIDNLRKIYATLIKQHKREKFINLPELHLQLQKEFILLSKKFGLDGKLEVTGHDLNDSLSKNEKIDVVITKNRIPLIAIEIDSYNTISNFIKLCKLKCKYKLWFNYSIKAIDFKKIESIPGFETVTIMKEDAPIIKTSTI